MLLHANASRVALREKGNENNEGRANMAPSSCQNDDEPGPGGTWARQRIRLRSYNVQMGKVNGGGVRLSEGRGQNNQQPTPNDNNKRVVVFLCGSGI